MKKSFILVALLGFFLIPSLASAKTAVTSIEINNVTIDKIPGGYLEFTGELSAASAEVVGIEYEMWSKMMSNTVNGVTTFAPTDYYTSSDEYNALLDYSTVNYNGSEITRTVMYVPYIMADQEHLYSAAFKLKDSENYEFADTVKLSVNGKEYNTVASINGDVATFEFVFDYTTIDSYYDYDVIETATVDLDLYNGKTVEVSCDIDNVDPTSKDCLIMVGLYLDNGYVGTSYWKLGEASIWNGEVAPEIATETDALYKVVNTGKKDAKGNVIFAISAVKSADTLTTETAVGIEYGAVKSKEITETLITYNYVIWETLNVNINYGTIKEYEYTKGENQTYDITKDSGLSFTIDADYSKFGNKVYMDGVLVDSANYTSKSGSTIITFTDAFAKTLTIGKHTIKVAFTDGEASADFTIAKTTEEIKEETPSEEPKNEETTTTADTEKETTTTETKAKTSVKKHSNPETGDNMPLSLGLIIISVIGYGISSKVLKNN